MDRTIKLFGIVAGIFAIFFSIALLSYLGVFQSVLLDGKLFSTSSPIGVFAIFAMLIFGGIYFFTAAGHVIKETVK